MTSTNTPQLEKGHTRIANELLEHLANELTGSGNQLAIVLLVMRYSYGYSRKFANFTILEIAERLGIDRKAARRSVVALEGRNILTVTPRPGHNRKRYQVQKNWRAWVKLTQGQSAPLKAVDKPVHKPGKTTRGEGQSAPVKGSKCPTIEGQIAPHQIKKETFKEKSAPKPAKRKRLKKGELEHKWPTWVDKSTALDFEKHRREKRAKLTTVAFTRLIKHLEEFMEKGVDPNAAIELSMRNSWQGVFPEKLVDKATGKQPWEQLPGTPSEWPAWAGLHGYSDGHGLNEYNYRRKLISQIEDRRKSE